MTKSEFSHALVTGGAGFIGSHLVQSLLDQGLAVTVLDDLSVGQKESVPAKARLIEGDVRDVSVLRDALSGVDVVFHLAAKVSIRASVETFKNDADVNLMGTLALVEALEGQSVRRVVMASSMAVYPDLPNPDPIDEDHALGPLSPYGTGKMAAERYLLQMGEVLDVDIVPLRFFNVYGPGQSYTPYVGVITIFATKLLQGETPVIFGDGEQVRDFVHVSDIVQGLVKAMLHGHAGRVYNIGAGQGRSVNDVARVLCAALAPNITPTYAQLHRVETRNSVADIRRAQAELNYDPKAIFERDIGPVLVGIKAKLSSD
ncbi:MAG: NAD-dependent epimerase/dehydratase family protein [Paracoccaceae bacterium]